MAWTNVTLPDRFSNLESAHEKIAELEFKVQRLNQKLDWYEKEFENLVKAAKEFGYVEITSNNGREKVKLVLERPA